MIIIAGTKPEAVEGSNRTVGQTFSIHGWTGCVLKRDGQVAESYTDLVMGTPNTIARETTRAIREWFPECPDHLIATVNRLVLGKKSFLFRLRDFEPVEHKLHPWPVV